MSMTMMKFALQQNVAVLRETMKKTKSLSGVELPENLVDLMYETMTAQGGETVHLVSVRDVLYSAIPLPFMPDRIDYKIGKGCCDEILKCDGLFVPCSKQCDGDKCAKHLKTPTGLGNYWDRHAAWSKNEPYCVIIKDKEVKEKSYGTYLHSKKLDSVAVTEELSKWGVSLQLDPSLFRAPAKPLKKSRGRKAEKKVASTESDDEGEESENSESEKSVSEKSGSDGEKSDEETEPKKKALPCSEDGEVSEDEKSEDDSEKPKEIKKKATKVVKEPKPPKAPKAPKESKPPKAPKAPKKPKAEPKVEPKAEPEPDHDSDDETLAQLTSKVQAIVLQPAEEPIVVEEPEAEESPTAVQSDEELEPPSDDEGLSMLSKAKPKENTEKKRSSSPKTEKPKAEKEKKRSSSPGELKKEAMEKKPKKGAVYKGKKETLSEVEVDGEDFLYKDGRYYNPESLELVAWDNKDEFELL